MEAESRKELLEKLASIEHDQWMKWAEAVKPEVSKERQARWEDYMVPYDQLDEKTKDFDREWAEKVLEVIEPLLGSSADEGAKVAKEMVTRFQIDASKYPNLTQLTQEG